MPEGRRAEPSARPGTRAGLATPGGSRLRRTPCVGVCSTTYGDLVCRGCKRFAHEIVGWNRFAESHRQLVWTRLATLERQSANACAPVQDGARLRAAAVALGVRRADVLPLDALVLPVLAAEAKRARGQKSAASSQAAARGPEELGLSVVGLDPELHGEGRVEDLLGAVDREFYLRSCAHFEASFKVPV